MPSVADKSLYLDFLTKKCESAKPGQYFVPVVILKVTPPKEPGNTKSPSKLMCFSLLNEPLEIKYRQVIPPDEKEEDIEGDFAPSVKRQKTDDNDVNTTIGPNQVFYCFNFDRQSLPRLQEGTYVRLAISADKFKGGDSFKCDKLSIDDNQCDVLSKQVYDKFIANSTMGMVPTLDTFADEQTSRTFVLPISSNNGVFPQTTVVFDESDPDNFEVETDEGPVVGITTPMNGKKATCIGVAYTLNNEGQTQAFLKLAYTKKLWEALGVVHLPIWKKVAPRLVYNTEEAFVYGYSMREKVQSMVTDDESAIVPTTGFATRMRLNLAKSVEKAGVPLSHAFVLANFGPESNHSFDDTEYLMHPINAGWKAKVKAGIKGTVINLTEVSDDHLVGFFKLVDETTNIRFYGVWPMDEAAPYEFTPTEEMTLEQMLAVENLVPPLLFAVI